MAGAEREGEGGRVAQLPELGPGLETQMKRLRQNDPRPQGRGQVDLVAEYEIAGIERRILTEGGTSRWMLR